MLWPGYSRFFLRQCASNHGWENSPFIKRLWTRSVGNLELQGHDLERWINNTTGWRKDVLTLWWIVPLDDTQLPQLPLVYLWLMAEPWWCQNRKTNLNIVEIQSPPFSHTTLLTFELFACQVIKKHRSWPAGRVVVFIVCNLSLFLLWNSSTDNFFMCVFFSAPFFPDLNGFWF